jgi:hypothetical protein
VYRASICVAILALSVATACSRDSPQIQIIGYSDTPSPARSIALAAGVPTIRRSTRPPVTVVGSASTPLPGDAGPVATETPANPTESPTTSQLASDPTPVPNPRPTQSAGPDDSDGDESSAAPTVTPAIPIAALSPSPVNAASEAQGLFVTSTTSSAKYYYGVDDSGWHRIHADHRKWFQTAADLLRAYPGRIPHPAPTRRVTPSPSPTGG